MDDGRDLFIVFLSVADLMSHLVGLKLHSVGVALDGYRASSRTVFSISVASLGNCWSHCARLFVFLCSRIIDRSSLRLHVFKLIHEGAFPFRQLFDRMKSM